MGHSYDERKVMGSLLVYIITFLLFLGLCCVAFRAYKRKRCIKLSRSQSLFLILVVGYIVYFATWMGLFLLGYVCRGYYFCFFIAGIPLTNGIAIFSPSQSFSSQRRYILTIATFILVVGAFVFCMYVQNLSQGLLHIGIK